MVEEALMNNLLDRSATSFSWHLYCHLRLKLALARSTYYRLQSPSLAQTPRRKRHACAVV